MAGPATDVFISYKAEERKRLIPLVGALEAEGFTVWWDQHISGGTNWREEIEAHLDAAKVVIVVWSKRSIGPEGRFVRDEAGQAQEAGHYLPITIDNVRPPLGFREVQALDLSSWWGKRDDPRFKILADTIRARLEGKEIKHHLVLPRGAAAVSRRAAIAGGVGVGTIAVAGVGGWLLLQPGSAEAKRIAVLPFANMSGSAEQAYFAEGIAEELRSALSRVGMEVIGRASSDAVKELDTKAAADKLGVAHILSGSVRRSPSMVRINAQLVRGRDGVEHWAQSYDRAPGDEIKIQTDIATSVAQALSIALGQQVRDALTLGGTSDSTAQDLVLRARELYNTTSDEASLRKAIDLTNEAITRDPQYADAYRMKAAALHALAGSFGRTPEEVAAGMGQARTAAARAIAIAPTLGITYTTIGAIERDRLNFAEALKHYRRALTLSPDDARVLSNAAIITYCLGDAQEALQLTERSIALDPLQPLSRMRRAEVLQALRRYPESIAAARKAIDLAPHATGGQWLIVNAQTLMGDYAGARATIRQLGADDPSRVVSEGLIAARTSDKAGAHRAIAAMRREYGAAASYQYAQIHAQLGDTDLAFAELDNAVEARDPGLLSLKIDPFLDPVRQDPRYRDLLKRLNFPA